MGLILFHLRNSHSRNSASGQAILEYILMLLAVVSFYLVLSHGLTRTRLGQALIRPVTGEFAKAYRYGHPKAKGLDEDRGPEQHPRANGRINLITQGRR